MGKKLLSSKFSTVLKFPDPEDGEKCLQTHFHYPVSLYAFYFLHY